jgi:TetR/AcrR family transcriptional repressor of bet genes
MAGQSPAERLKALLSADFNEVVCTPRTLAAWCAFWAEAQSRPTYLEHCSANDDEYQQITIELCRELVAEGQYAFAPEPIARSLEAMMEGLWLDLMTTQAPFSRKEALDTVFACLAALFPKHFAPDGAVIYRSETSP